MLLRALAAASALLQAADPQLRRQETVDVERVVVEVRVLDGRGRPLPGLAAADFRLDVDGRPVRIESARWVEPAAARTPPEAGAELAPPSLLVLLFQKDLSATRGAGLLRIQHSARAFLRRLDRDHLVAVASHDSRLRLWLDFTSDRAAAERALSESVLFGRPVRPAGPAGPSLRGALDDAAARRASTPEAALESLASALEGLPGARTLVMFGWGLGALGPMGVRMTPGYEDALSALARAGVSVFTLDLTGADFHSLEAGLQQVARDTGGTYARTHLFPDAAVRRLEAALAGHYLLSFERPALARGEHRMRIHVPGRQATVLARTRYVDPE